MHQPKLQPARTRLVPGLDGVSETMLWSLHNRACEARRADTILADPESIRIEDAIDYDFAGHFGRQSGSLAARAAAIDAVLRRWLALHPDGLVVSLGEGLETQSRRVDNGRMGWLSVDLPAAIRLRERFLPQTDRFRHLAASALDPAWMDEIDPDALHGDRPLFIVVQGLLMYLTPEQARAVLSGIAERVGAAQIVFDAVPRWFSALTLHGLQPAARYRLPPMPWGIDRDQIAATLQGWHSRLGDVTLLDYRMPRGLPRLLAEITSGIAVMRHQVPSLAHVVWREDGTHGYADRGDVVGGMAFAQPPGMGVTARA